MAYKRYAKKNGKIYGPYYYESYREDGKVKKIYIGQKLPPSSVVPRSKLFSFVVIFIALAVLISLAFFIKPTGKVSLQTEPNYELDEFLSGQATITLQEGDSIQKDTQITLALLKEDTILAETTKTLEEFFGSQINYVEVTNDSISCVNITVPYEQEVCENVTNPETIEEVCHDEQLENETIQVCENVTTPEETILVCTNQTLENSEENCTTTMLTDYYYQTPGSYSVDLQELLDFSLTEPGDYVLRFSIPSLGVESESLFNVENETIPPEENITGMDIPMHAENLVNNDGFETWTNGAGPFTLVGNTTADYWILMQEGMGGCGPTVTRTSTAGQYRSGSYGLKWDVTACWNYNMWGAGGVYYNITNYQNFANKTVNFSIWMNTSEPQGHAPGRVFIDDGVIRTYSANHTGDGTWQLLSVQATVSSSPTKLWAGAVLHGRQPNQAGTSAIFYVDDATMSMRANVSSCGNLSVADGVYVLTQNITIPGGNCFIINANNVTLDCQGYTINGTYSSGFGIYNVGFKNITVKNCRIIQFLYGIYFVTNANEGTIINNTVNLNQLGIVFGTANNNTITNNTVNYNTNYGIFLNIASDNNYTNNNASGNTIGDFLSQGNSLNNRVVNLTTQQNLISFISKDIMLKGLTTAGVPTDLSGYKNISKYLSITNNAGDSWIYLNISYNDSNVPAGIPESSLKLWKNNASGWFLAGAGINSVDTANNIVYANITQFGSTFAPLGQVPDYSPNVTLISPNNGFSTSLNSITFVANVSDDIGFVNASIWHNVSGIFAPNSTWYPGVITPDSTTKGLWHFDESDNKTAEDSALTNDGTHYGNTVSLWRFDENTGTTAYDAAGLYGNNGTLDYSRTLVENCNSTAGWTVGPSGNSISLNTTVFKEGSNAINLIKGATDTTSFYAYKNIPSTNMSNRYINLWIYVKDSTALGKINYPFVYVMDQYPPVNWWIRKDFSQSFLSVGWNLLSFDTSSPSASFGTPNLAAAGATGMGFFTTASSYTTSAGDVIMDYFFLTSTTPAGPTWAAGKSNTGLSFDGVNDYVSIADAASLKFGSSDFALEAWVKTSSSANQIIIDKQKETANFNFYGIRIYNSKIWAAASDCGTGGCGFGTTRWPLVGNKTLTDGVWHHVAFTREGASLKVYVDGILDNSTSQGPWNTDSTSQFMIGAYNPSNPQQFFNGTIDEFAAYNKSLSASEVLAHYNAGKAKFTDWTTGRFGNAIEFDGIDDYVEVQDSASLRSPTTQITLAAWIRTGGRTTAQEIIEKDYGPANATGWQSYDISLSSENKFAFAVSEGSVFEGGGDYIYWISTQSLANNTWYFVAGTWNYSAGDKFLNGKIYINGQNVSYTNLNTSGVVTAIGHNGTGGTVWIGRLASTGTPSYHFNGTIDEVVIYNRTLSASEILDLYQKRNATINWTLANIPAGTYKWNVQAFDNAGQSDWGDANWTFTKVSVPGANYLTFGGSTTPFDSVENIENVSGATLEKVGYGKIVWNGSVNASGADFDTNVNISSNFVRVNSSALNPSFNTSANVTIYNVPYSPVYPYWDPEDDGTFVVCPTSICTNVTYTGGVGGNLSFTTAHFTSFSGGGAVNDCGSIDSNGTYYLIQDINSSATCITINASDVELDCQGYTIDGDDSGDDYGIYNTGGYDNVTIKNCIITDFYNGIHFINGANNSIIDNNTVNSNTGSGIIFDSSSNNTLTNNNASSNTYYGIAFSSNSNNGVLTNNIANLNGEYGIWLSSSSNNNLTSNIANSNTYSGIYFNVNSNNTLTSNTANSNGQRGIYLDTSSNNTLTNNNASSNNYGISLYSSSNNNNLTGNNANSNSFGIYLYSISNNNRIANNNASSNSYGIYLYFSSNNNLSNNNATGNSQWDFYSYWNSLNNIVTNLTTQQNLVSFISKDIALKGITTGVPADPSGYYNISKYINITNNSATGWIYLNVSYNNETDVPVDVNESTLKIYKYNASNWALVPGTNGVDLVTKIVYANITQFGSTFAPLGFSGTEILTGLLVCVVNQTSCDVNYTEVLHMSNYTNAHAELANTTTDYNYTICCKDALDVISIGTNDTGTLFLRLSNYTDAHVEKSSGANYSYPAYISASSGGVSCSYSTSCVGNQTCLATISGDTDAHIAGCGVENYSTKICCELVPNVISSCPYNITKSDIYIINQSLTSEGDCILINATEAILDCGSNSITGNGSGIGVNVSGFDNATIRNCIIMNFSTGILLADNSFGIIRDNRMNANYYGLQLLTSNDNEIETNNASGNEFADFYSEGGGLGNIITNLTTQQNLVSFTSKDISLKGLTTAGVPLDLSGYKNISKYLNITNNSATGWIYLNVSYDETFDVPLDVAESTLKLYRYNNTDWVLANTTSADNGVDTTNKVVYANITDFGSTFAPLGPISLPNATILGPGNGTITNDSYVNFTINLSAQAGLANATLNIYNETGGLYNQTTINLGGVFQTTLGIVVWLADGVYNWFWEVLDLMSNIVNTGIQEGGNRTITADATAPALDILFPLPIAYNYHNQTLNFSVYDNTSGLDTCWKRLNDGQNVTISCYENSTVNSSTEGTVEGDNTIYLWANDSASNIASDSVYYTISTTTPSILLLTPENGSWLNHSDVNFSFNVVDESGMDTCELWGNWTGVWHNNQTFTSITNGSTLDVIKNISDGSYIWNVWCNDSINNAGWHPDNHTFMVDATIPLVSIDYPGNTTYNINVSELNYTALDTNLEACWYSLDGGANNATITCGNNASGLTSNEESNTWVVYANDSAGNVNYSSVTFFKDTIIPLITIESPQNITYNNNTILVNLSVVELNIDNIWFFNGTDNETYTDAVYVNFSEGGNILYAYVNDSAGNLNSTSVVFNTDTTPPNATIIAPENGTITNGSYVNFTINLSDQNGLANATLNIYNETGDLYNQTTFTFTGSPIQYTLGIVVWLADGVYNWFWEVLDVMSNIVNTGVQEGGNRTITADTIAPAITIVSPINTTYNNRTQLVNISASDVNLNTTWFFNGTENVTYTTPDYVTFDEGGNTLYAYVNDSAGNLNSTSVVFSTDTIFPIYDNLTALPTPPTSYLPGQNYSFNATWTDNFGVESVIFEFNGTNYTTNNLGGGIYNFNVSELVAGNYSYRWIANDSVGNTNQTDISYYLIDKASFNLTINIAPSNVVFRGTQTNVTGLDCPAQLSCLLYRNNINVSNPDIGKFEAGIYYYNYNTTGNENYTLSNKSASLTVNAPPVPPCVDVWTCGAWGSCVGSQQTRTCDSGCGDTRTETQSCCIETTVTCGAWSECANDEQIRECVSNCGTTTTESQACVLCVPEWSCTSFSSCVSGTITRTCTDSNNCGSEVGRPEETKECGVELGKEGCSVNYSCGDWSECEYDSDASKILQGVIVEKGFKERECTDLNNCAGIYTERSSCTSEVQIETEQEDVCDKSTLTLFEKTSKSPVTSIDIESWNANKLDVAFTQQRAEYCPTCYNGVKDDDEENVDCGKSCRSCKSESKLPESTLPISASLIVLSLLMLIPILKFFFEDYMIIRDVHALVKSGEAALKAGNREKAESDFRKMKWKYIQIEGNAKKKVILKEIYKYHSKIKKFTGF